MNLADGTLLWAAEWTAVGTLALAAVTLLAIVSTIMITKQDRKRTDKRLTTERERHDKEIADERTAAEKRLAEQTNAAEARLKTQMAHSEGQLREQQQAADARLQEDRQLARLQEQLTEAWSVQVLGVRIPPGENVISTPENPSERPVAIVVNSGRYTITQVDACFSDGTATFAREAHQSYSDIDNLPFQLKQDVAGVIGEAYFGVLIAGASMRLIGGAMQVRNLRGMYAIVRWTDRWGTRWEHRRGDVRKIEPNEDWHP